MPTNPDTTGRKMLSAGGSRRPLRPHTAPAFRPRSRETPSRARETPSRATLAACCCTRRDATARAVLVWQRRRVSVSVGGEGGGGSGRSPFSASFSSGVIFHWHRPLPSRTAAAAPRTLAVTDFCIAGQFYSSKDRATLVEQPRRATSPSPLGVSKRPRQVSA